MDDELGTFSTGGSSDSDDDNFDEADLDFESIVIIIVITTTTSTTTTILYFIASHTGALLTTFLFISFILLLSTQLWTNVRSIKYRICLLLNE